MYKNIALATDGSDHSKRAAENAIRIASKNCNSNIDIIYVVDQDKVKSDVLNNWNIPGSKDRYKER